MSYCRVVYCLYRVFSGDLKLLLLLLNANLGTEKPHPAPHDTTNPTVMQFPTFALGIWCTYWLKMIC